MGLHKKKMGLGLQKKINPPKGLDPSEVLLVSQHTALEILLVSDPIGIQDPIGF